MFSKQNEHHEVKYIFQNGGCPFDPENGELLLHADEGRVRILNMGRDVLFDRSEGRFHQEYVHRFHAHRLPRDSSGKFRKCPQRVYTIHQMRSSPIKILNPEKAF